MLERQAATTPSSETHEQALACFRCGLANAVPIYRFPLPSGLWDWPCPACGRHSIWITDVIPKNGDGPLSQDRAFSLVEDYLLGAFRSLDH